MAIRTFPGFGGPVTWLARRVSGAANSPGAYLLGGFNSAFGVSQAFTNAVSRSAQYETNDLTKNLIPEPGELLTLFNRGWITRQQVERFLGKHGVQTDGTGLFAQNAPLWNAIITESASLLSIDTAIDFWNQGIIDDGRLKSILLRHGFKEGEYWPLFGQLWTPLGLSDATHAWRQGLITAEQWRRQLGRIGFSRPEDLFVQQGISNPPVGGEILELLNRKLIDDIVARNYLAIGGMPDFGHQEHYLALRNILPSVQDVIQFAVKDAWDAAVVNRFGYDLDFPAELGYWAERIGIKWSEDVAIPGMPVIPGVTWDKLHWRAHWRNIAPGQAAQMFHRFRPGRVDRYREAGFNLRPFTREDYLSVLKINDYASGFRDYVAALGYNRLTRRDVQRLYTARIIDRQEVIEIFRDSGLLPTDAERLANGVAETDRLKSVNQMKLLTKAKVQDAYKVGVIGRLEAGRQLYQLGLTSTQEMKDWMELGQAAQVARAQNNELVQSELDHLDLDLAVQKVKRVLTSVRRAWIKGDISDDMAIGVMTQMGIIPQRVQAYLDEWRNNRVGSRKQLTAMKVLQLYEKGLINATQAFGRLTYLGYSATDVQYLIALSNKSIASAAAHAQAAAARTEKQRQAAQAAIIKSAQRERATAVKKLLGTATPAQLLRWLKKGIVTELEVRARLVAHGWLAHDIDSAVAEALTSATKSTGEEANGAAATAGT